MFLKNLKKPIKIFDVYIHYTTIFLVVTAFWFEFLHRLLIAYAITAIHETAHIFVMHRLGVKTKRVEVLPFGITARLYDEGVLKPRDEITIALAGPISNFIIAYLAYGLVGGYWKTYIVCTSLAIGIFNLLPALPLDGGRILRAALVSRYGCICGQGNAMKITVFCGVAIVLAGIWVLFVTKFNFTVLLTGTFMIANITEEIKSARFIVMKDILYSRKKLEQRGGKKGETLVVKDCEKAVNILPRLTYDKYFLINIVDDDMNIEDTVTETSFVEGLAVFGTDISMRKFVGL